MRSHGLASAVLVVVSLGAPVFGNEKGGGATPSPAPATPKVDLSGVVQLWSLASKAGVFAGLPDLVMDRLFKAGVQLLSGNRTELLSRNAPQLLSGNKPSVLSNNRLSLFSNIKVDIHITVTNTGNHNGNDNEVSAHGQVDHPKGR